MDSIMIGEANVDGITHLALVGEGGFAADGDHLDLDGGSLYFASLLSEARSAISRTLLLLELSNRAVGVEFPACEQGCCSVGSRTEKQVRYGRKGI